MKITTGKTEEILVIHAEGRLDTVTVREFDKSIYPTLEEGLSFLKGK